VDNVESILRIRNNNAGAIAIENHSTAEPETKILQHRLRKEFTIN